MGLKRTISMTVVVSSLAGCGSFDFGLGGSDTDGGGWTSAGATASAGVTAGGGPGGGNACDAYAANAAACDPSVDEDSLLIYCYATAAETLEISQSCAYAHQVLLQCVANQGCTAGGHDETPAACSQQETAVEDACERGDSTGSTGSTDVEDGSSSGEGSSSGDSSTSDASSTSGEGSSSSGSSSTSGGSDSTG